MNTIIKNLFSSFVFVTLSLFQTLALGQANATIIPLELSPGQVIHLQYSVSQAEVNKPVFLLLPGVNRSVLLEDSSVTELKKRGFGVAVMNFSGQPFSVNLLPDGVQPLFKKRTFKLEDFVNEVETVVSYLKIQKKIKRVIPVSLSYSGSITPFLKSTEETIETAPMTSSEAVNPELEQWIRTLKAGEFFNPIFGPAINRNLLDSAYRKKWAAQVDSITQQFNLNLNQRDNMIEGYTSLSRVVEGFDWKNLKISKSIKRSIIIAENESKALQKNQAEAALRLIKQGTPVVVYLLKSSGHVVPADQPAAFAAILARVATTALSDTGVAVVDPLKLNQNLSLLTGSQATAQLELILKD